MNIQRVISPKVSHSRNHSQPTASLSTSKVPTETFSPSWQSGPDFPFPLTPQYIPGVQPAREDPRGIIGGLDSPLFVDGKFTTKRQLIAEGKADPVTRLAY